MARDEWRGNVKIRETTCGSISCCSLGHIGKEYEGKTCNKMCCPKRNTQSERKKVVDFLHAWGFWHPHCVVGSAMSLAAIRYSNCITHSRGWNGVSCQTVNCFLVSLAAPCLMYPAYALKADISCFLYVSRKRRDNVFPKFISYRTRRTGVVSGSRGGKKLTQRHIVRTQQNNPILSYILRRTSKLNTLLFLERVFSSLSIRK